MNKLILLTSASLFITLGSELLPEKVALATCNIDICSPTVITECDINTCSLYAQRQRGRRGGGFIRGGRGRGVVRGRRDGGFVRGGRGRGVVRGRRGERFIYDDFGGGFVRGRRDRRKGGFVHGRHGGAVIIYDRIPTNYEYCVQNARDEGRGISYTQLRCNRYRNRRHK